MVKNNIHDKVEEEKEFRESITGSRSTFTGALKKNLTAQSDDISMVDMVEVTDKSSFRKQMTGGDNLSRLHAKKQNVASPNSPIRAEDSIGARPSEDSNANRV